MEGRVHNEFEGIKTPVGIIPRYDDLRQLFSEIFNKEYKKEDYKRQFSIRVSKFLERMERMEGIFRKEGVPKEIEEQLELQKQRLMKVKEFGEIISPEVFLDK